jgi:hypothetical protein
MSLYLCAYVIVLNFSHNLTVIGNNRIVAGGRSTSVKSVDSYPQTSQRKYYKIADAQLSPGCVFADPRGLLDSATQMNCGMESLVLQADDCASLPRQERFACPADNSLFNPETALKYVQQIAAQRAVLGGSLRANASSVLVREAPSVPTFLRQV